MSNNENNAFPETLGTLLKWGESELAAAGIPEAALEAGILLASLLKTERARLYLDFDRQIETSDRELYKSYILRRVKHEPVAYITGFIEFYSLPFQVDKRVLIPRPETEYILEEILAKVEGSGKSPQYLLDLCTGSGCIAISCVRFTPQLNVLGTDLSDGALELARANARLNGLSPSPHSRLHFIQSDLFKGIPREYQSRGFDYIVSNPPYIQHSVIETLMPDVKDYEPVLALDGGPDGMEILDIILAQSVHWLKPGGWLILEIGYDQGDAIKNKLEHSGAYTIESIEIKKDFSNLDRIAIAQKKEST